MCLEEPIYYIYIYIYQAVSTLAGTSWVTPLGPRLPSVESGPRLPSEKSGLVAAAVVAAAAAAAIVAAPPAGAVEGQQGLRHQEMATLAQEGPGGLGVRPKVAI